MKLSDRQLGVLARLAKVQAGNGVSFHGHNLTAAYKLSQIGFAEHIGPDKWWTGQIYKITDKGRAAAKGAGE